MKLDKDIEMDLSNTIAYRLYPLYNWLAIHNVPIWILDLFIPILTTTKWSELWYYWRHGTWKEETWIIAVLLPSVLLPSLHFIMIS